MKTLYALPFAALLFSGLVEAAPAPAAPVAAPAPAAPAAAPAPVATAAAPVIPPISVTISNPLATVRPRETVALVIADLVKLAPGFDGRKSVVVDTAGMEVISQLVDTDGDERHDEIVFQADLGAQETKTFWIRTGERKPATRDQYQVYGRFVRERYDDFAWENDMVAHRVYGAALETHPKEPLVSSGVDTWVKLVSKLVVNDWYMTGNYHKDNGEGADFYSVGKSRGLGGLGVWAKGKLYVSKNFVKSRVLACGPVRLVFELTYDPWKAGGQKVSEVKRVTLDAGSYFNRVESTFAAKKRPLSIGIGIAKHAGSAVAVDAAAGTMQAWEPLDGGKAGNLATAIVLPAGAKPEEQHNDLDYLVVTPVPADNRLVFYAGSAWDQAGNIRDAATWAAEVRSLAAKLAAPVQVGIAVQQ
ncbi:MAG: DUF4861 family protein [Deltaproteobacteria bacterium]|nr:DUF4861 family protein [Deltaproteobacteria bacterium]